MDHLDLVFFIQICDYLLPQACMKNKKSQHKLPLLYLVLFIVEVKKPVLVPSGYTIIQGSLSCPDWFLKLFVRPVDRDPPLPRMAVSGES